MSCEKSHLSQNALESDYFTVKYIDRENNSIFESTVLSGKVGFPYESEAKEIRGYLVIEEHRLILPIPLLQIIKELLISA